MVAAFRPVGGEAFVEAGKKVAVFSG